MMLLIVLGVFMAHLPAIRGGFIWDDEGHITKPELRSVNGLWRIWTSVGATQQYYPLLHSFFWVEHKLWGDATVGYHLANISLHAVAATLVWRILRRLKIAGAMLAAGIFALHPVHVESVAWITEQKNTLSAVFYLSAALVYLRFDEQRNLGQYVLAMFLFVLALLSKTVTASLPAALLVVFWWQRGRLSWKRDVLPLVPWLVLGAVGGMLTVWVERKLIGAEGEAYELTLVQRGLLAGRAIWFYLGKLFWPANLIFIYPRWQISAAAWWQWVYPATALVGISALWMMRGRWRGPLAGVLFFIGTLFPVLGFFNVFPFIYSYVADHFQYLASLGIIVVLAAVVSRAMSPVPSSMRLAFGVLFLSLLGVLTWRQSRMYADIETLYETTIQKNPDCSMAHTNLGNEMLKRRKLREAISHLRRALELSPEAVDSHYNLGLALAAAGKTQEAIAHLRRAAFLNPKDSEVRTSLANALFDARMLDEAIETYRIAVQLSPDFAEGYYNLANALIGAGQPQEAIGHYWKALQLKPDLAPAHLNLGIALANSGQVLDGISHCEQALRIKPEWVEAHELLGTVLVRSGQFVNAAKHFEQALKLQPTSATACFSLAKCHVALGRRSEGIQAARRALMAAQLTGKRALAQEVETWLTRLDTDQLR